VDGDAHRRHAELFDGSRWVLARSLQQLPRASNERYGDRVNKPQLPPGATAVKLCGLAWRGNRLDIEYDAVNLVVTVLQHDDGSDAGDDGEGAVLS
jgi:hypothetical protein